MAIMNLGSRTMSRVDEALGLFRRFVDAYERTTTVLEAAQARSETFLSKMQQGEDPWSFVPIAAGVKLSQPSVSVVEDAGGSK